MSKINDLIRFRFKLPYWKLGLAAAALVVVLYFLMGGASTRSNGSTFAVRRGPLQISVLEGGSAEALEAQEIRSQIKGYQGTKILSIVEEGYLVTEDDIKKGKVLVELDSSDLRQRITTQEIQYQSTLSALIEAQQAYDIQLNQNVSDTKAAEQKARFARMDLAKHLGDKNTQEIIDQMGLYEKPFTNELELAEIESELALTESNRVPTLPLTAPGAVPASIRPESPGGPTPGERGPNPRPPRGEPGSEPARPGRRQPAGEGERTPAPTASIRSGAPLASGEVPGVNPAPGRNPPPGERVAPPLTASATNIVKPFHLESGSPTPLPGKVIRLGGGTAWGLTNAPLIDFAKYAKSEKLGDGAAKQQLRKLEDDVLLSTQELSQAQIKLSGTQRLYASNFVTKTELDSDQLSVKRTEVKLAAAQTAYDLYIKYEFTKTTEEFVSKYDEALRSLERARKEAISKLAQARARLKAAEGRYRIETEQRQELVEQLSNCVIRAERPGLVIYGGGRDRGFMFNEEQIREGVTVRERQPIITIPDMTKMAVKVRIHESHIQKITKGQKARITADAFPDEKLTGEVIKVAVLPDSQNRWMNPDMKVYMTSIGIDGMREWLKPGMSAKVEILVKELPDVVYVPIQAVVPVKGKQVCFLVNGGAPEQREVEIGEFNDEFIEIKKGLRPGEKVFLRAPEGIETDTSETEVASEDEPIEGGQPKPAPTLVPASVSAAPPKTARETREAGPGTARAAPRPNRQGP